MTNTSNILPQLAQLKEEIDKACAIIVGAGAGMSTSAGFDYAGERFKEHFSDFEAAYNFTDMYSGGFYPYQSLEEKWAFWSKMIWLNRYSDIPRNTYEILLRLLHNHDFFVLTTNVDHCFQRAGFPKERLFYTQGDYGLWQCAKACHSKTYDNYHDIKAMLEQCSELRIPTSLIPRCPVCGGPMETNLRSDEYFVEDEGWHKAAARYSNYLDTHNKGRILYLELGVGYNTPGIIKYPFWTRVLKNPQARFASINLGEGAVPLDIKEQSIVINGGIHEALVLLEEISS